jgi:nucleoid DNA-binding protein
MSKASLVKAVQNFTANEKIPLSRAFCDRLVTNVFHHITDQVKATGRFAFPDFGVFKLRAVNRRSTYRNPRTGEKLEYKGPKTVNTMRFKPSRSLLDMLLEATPAPKNPARGTKKSAEKKQSKAK